MKDGLYNNIFQQMPSVNSPHATNCHHFDMIYIQEPLPWLRHIKLSA